MAKFQTPRGTRDFLPEEMIKRQHVLQKVRSVFEKWGFDPIETPAFEEWELLSAKSGGGQEIKNEIYYFKDKGDRELGLRFDLTVPLARIIATNPNLPKPFRRYHIGPVWRYDRPGAGRYREFWQCDVDIVGAPAGEAEALCIAVACDALQRLGFDDFTVRVSNRKIVEAFLLSIGIKKDRVVDALRSIDKAEKIGEDGVGRELKEKKFSTEEIKKITSFVKSKTLSEVKNLAGKNDLGKEGVKELEDVFSCIEPFGIMDKVKFDVSLVRGLEYYTGPVFEIASEKHKSSIGGGGRYDNLIETFGGPPTKAVGISLGVERIIEIMDENQMFSMPKTATKIYIAPVSESVKADVVKVAKELIELGVSTEFDLMNRSISKQLDYANAKGIPFVLVLGQKEFDSRKAKMRDMKTGEEKDIHLGSLEEVKKLLK